MALPVFSLAQVIAQLRTSWSDTNGSTYPFQGPNIAYTILSGNAPLDSSPENAGWLQMTALQASRAAEAFEVWDDLMAVSLTQGSANPAANASAIQFAYSSATDHNGTYEYGVSGYYTGQNEYGTASYNVTRAEIWLNSNWSTHNSTSAINQAGYGYYGGYGFLTYMHEIGHALGLSHPGVYNAQQATPLSYANDAEYAQDTRRFSIMSYWNANDDASGTDHSGANGVWQYAQTPMLHDVAAIQAIYGADYTTRAGDTVYGFNSTAGRDLFDFAKNTDPILTIWDGGGIDTLDCSGFGAGQYGGQRIDLNAGAYSDIGGYMTNNVAIAFGCVIENAIGGSGADTITGNSADNWLMGGGGNDSITGGGGADTISYLTATIGVNVQLNMNFVDAISAGHGFDTLASIEQAEGGSGGDQFWGSNDNNTFWGNAGSDWLHGFVGSDTLHGDDGSDQLLGGDGIDYLFGEGGNDYFWFDEFDAAIAGGPGTDYAYLVTTNGCNVNLFSSSLDGVWAGNGNDILNAGGMTTYAYLIGYAGSDTITGGSAGDYIWVDFSAGDIIDGNGGRDEMYHIGTAGISVNLATSELEVVVGAGGVDVLNGATVATYVQLYGRGGNDVLTGSAFGDYLYGDSENDTLRGNDGNDYINGGTGTNDRAQYAGVAGNYTVTSLGGGVYTVAGFGFTDTLVGVEFLDFDGGGTLDL